LADLDEPEMPGAAGNGGAPPARRHGDELAADGDLRAAEEAYRDADAAGDPTAATKLGLLLEHRGRRGEALAAYERADERGDGPGAFRLGMLMTRLGRWDDATAAWARAETRGKEVSGLWDPHTPGGQGPTYKGRTHVPAGETFSRNPTTGPQLARNPSNP
jgi:TPR repeat protein